MGGGRVWGEGQGFGGSEEKGYLFSWCWGALVIILVELINFKNLTLNF